MGSSIDAVVVVGTDVGGVKPEEEEVEVDEGLRRPDVRAGKAGKPKMGRSTSTSLIIR